MKDGPGVLLLSEFAGCAGTLCGCVRMNPWAPDDAADAIHSALMLTRTEREQRWNMLYASVCNFSAKRWASSFVAAMQETGG